MSVPLSSSPFALPSSQAGSVGPAKILELEPSLSAERFAARSLPAENIRRALQN